MKTEIHHMTVDTCELPQADFNNSVCFLFLFFYSQTSYTKFHHLSLHYQTLFKDILNNFGIGVYLFIERSDQQVLDLDLD